MAILQCGHHQAGVVNENLSQEENSLWPDAGEQLLEDAGESRQGILMRACFCI